MTGCLEGRIGLVCGASTGIGRAIAQRFQAEGAEIWGLARNKEALDDLGLAGSLVLDLDDLDALETRLSELPPAVLLVNNTGGPPGGAILDAEAHEFGKAFRRHVMASHVLVRALLPHMKDAGFGRILNVVSTSVREPIPDLGVSNTVRAAMAGWAKSVSKELPPGITINNLLPGFTDTTRLASLMEARAEKQGVSVEEIEANWIAGIPEGRLGQPEEIAGAAAFLASPEGAYVRGQSLAVDGGRLNGI